MGGAGDLITALKYKMCCYKKDGDKSFSVVAGEGQEVNKLQLQQGKFRVDIQKNFFTVKMTEHWIRLYREAVVASLSLEMLQ